MSDSRPPSKPRKDFNLWIKECTGYWCNKVRGRVYYFGKVADDPKGLAALAQWQLEKDDLQAGREPREKTAGLTVETLCFKFLEYQELRTKDGEIKPRTFYSSL